MPLTIAALAARKATLTFPYLGDEVTITYRVGLYTPAFEERPLFEGMADIVESWDVVGEDGPYPITLESLSALDEAFVREVARQIARDVHLGPTSAGTSGAS